MKTSKTIITLLAATAITLTSCRAQKSTQISNTNDMKNKATIWAVTHKWVETPESMEAIEVDVLAVGDTDFVRECSIEVKTIIAFYSKLYIYEECTELADALGNFPSLKEAQQALLKDREHYFSQVQTQGYLLGIFEIELEKDMAFITHTAMQGSYKNTEKFRIHGNGGIEYIYK